MKALAQEVGVYVLGAIAVLAISPLLGAIWLIAAGGVLLGAVGAAIGEWRGV